MKPLTTITAIFIISTFIYPQDIKYVKGKVVYELENNVEEPQIGITVLIESTGDRDKTDHNGIFKIFLNNNLKSGDRISFAIEKNGWAIRDPLFGNTHVPSVCIKKS